MLWLTIFFFPHSQFSMFLFYSYSSVDISLDNIVSWMCLRSISLSGIHSPFLPLPTKLFLERDKMAKWHSGFENSISCIPLSAAFSFLINTKFNVSSVVDLNNYDKHLSWNILNMIVLFHTSHFAVSKHWSPDLGLTVLENLQTKSTSTYQKAENYLFETLYLAHRHITSRPRFLSLSHTQCLYLSLTHSLRQSPSLFLWLISYLFSHSTFSNQSGALDTKLMDIAMDGPYGRFVSYSDHKVVVLVAGAKIKKRRCFLCETFFLRFLLFFHEECYYISE